MNKKKLLHIIMSNLHENWCSSTVNSGGKACAWTDSEIAANALTEILNDLGYEEQNVSGSKSADYRRDDLVLDGVWGASFIEL